MLYVEILKKHYNNVGRTFCDAIINCNPADVPAGHPAVGLISEKTVRDVPLVFQTDL